RRVPKLGVKAVALFWMGGCSTLFGQVLFDSLSDQPIGQPVGDPEEVQVAARFSTQSSTTVVTDITLRLQQVSSTGSYSVGLYSDNGLPGNADAPSAFLQPVATGNMGNLPTSFNDIHFSGLSLGVEPNSSYWVVVSTDDTSHTLEWAFSNTIMP